MDIRRIGSIKKGDEVVGSETRVKVVKNKVAPPFKQAEFDIMYAEGISHVGLLVDIGSESNIIEKSGAWYSYNGQRIGQGRENAKLFLKDNPVLAADIEEKVKGVLGIRTVAAAEAEAGARYAALLKGLPSGSLLERRTRAAIARHTSATKRFPHSPNAICLVPATVSAIREHHRRKGRFVIEVDGSEAAVVPVDTISQLGLHTGVELGTSVLRQLEVANRRTELLDRALNILAAHADTASAHWRAGWRCGVGSRAFGRAGVPRRRRLCPPARARSHRRRWHIQAPCGAGIVQAWRFEGDGNGCDQRDARRGRARRAWRGPECRAQTHALPRRARSPHAAAPLVFLPRSARLRV
jgi:hypothetical protein